MFLGVAETILCILSSSCFVNISSKLQFGHQQLLSARLGRPASSAPAYMHLCMAPPLVHLTPFAVACFRRKKSARGRLIKLLLICILLSARLGRTASSAAAANLISYILPDQPKQTRKAQKIRKLR